MLYLDHYPVIQTYDQTSNEYIFCFLFCHPSSIKFEAYLNQMELPLDVKNNETIIVVKQIYSLMLSFIIIFRSKHEYDLENIEKYIKTFAFFLHLTVTKNFRSIIYFLHVLQSIDI